MDNNVYFAAAASYDQQTVDAAVERLFSQLPAAEALAGGGLGLVDVLGVLAAGALVDGVAALVDALVHLVRVVVGELLGLVEDSHVSLPFLVG